jgi:hypothetical protein
MLSEQHATSLSINNLDADITITGVIIDSNINRPEQKRGTNNENKRPAVRLVENFRTEKSHVHLSPS